MGSTSLSPPTPLPEAVASALLRHAPDLLPLCSKAPASTKEQQWQERYAKAQAEREQRERELSQDALTPEQWEAEMEAWRKDMFM